MTETELVSGLLEALRMRRVFAWRNNSGKLVVGKGPAKRFINLGPAGAPDILGVVPRSGGRLFGLECKSPKGKLRPSQALWKERAEREGVPVAVVRTIGEGLRAVERWQEGA